MRARSQLEHYRNAGRDQRIRQAAKAGTPVTIIARDERLSPT